VTTGAADARAVPLEDWGLCEHAESGDPHVRGMRLSERGGERPEVGVWCYEPGGWPVVDRPDTEVAAILQGRARITNGDGTTVELWAGDAVMLPKGWSGHWEVLETVRKLYVLI
jgi:uncharacterized protein